MGLAGLKNKKMTKANSALKFINEAKAKNFIVLIQLPTRVVKITPKNFKQWQDAGKDLFKIDSEGNLRMAFGKRYDIIVTKTHSFCKISASNY